MKARAQAFDLTCPERLAQAFEGGREQLRALAARMLGSLDEADDALQEAWLHASRAQRQEVRDLDP